MIDLSEQLDFLPTHKREELESITGRILETGMVSMIILYGSFARGDWKEKPGIRSGKRSDYDILVLTKDERDCGDLKKRLYKMFDNSETVVQTTVETIGFVNMHLREKQYFFTEITKQGVVLYAEKRVKLAEAEDLSPVRLKEIAEKDFKHWFGTAEENMEHAEYAKHKFLKTSSHKSAQKAAFEFQQCVENCYTAIEIVFSRNNPYEHRLSVLRMNAKRYAPEVDTCFPRDDSEGSLLFSHLDAAYIGGRYIDEENYKVEKEQLEYWEVEAKKLLEITERVCLERIGAL
jgi:predicted nucleotidyltransferase